MNAMELLSNEKLTVELFLNKVTYEDESIYKDLAQREDYSTILIDEEEECDSIDDNSSEISVLSTVSSSSVASSSSTKINRLCCNCKIQPNEICLVPCGHYAYCEICWISIDKNEINCFYCKQPVIAGVKPQ